MNKVILLISFSLLFFTNQNKAQNAYCDSITVDSVYVNLNTLNITVYNSSQLFIAYPFFTVHLDTNNYIQLNDSVTVLSYLSVIGDANNGYSNAAYSGNLIPDNLVPLNTVFTGTITITDPNDSTFNCVYPFSFLYGTNVTGVYSYDIQNIRIYPNPANDFFNIYIDEINYNSDYFISDHTGRNIASGKFNSTINSIDLTGIESGIYYLQIMAKQPYLSKIVILKNQ